MAKLFGTDGVRGVANTQLTAELAYRLGRAGAHVLTRQGQPKKVIIGRDTRISGDMLEAALAAGVCSVGVDVYQVGVLPTPAIAYLTRALGAGAGVVISASHNPVEDNGIKFFGPSGYKLPDELETQIEKLATDAEDKLPKPTGGELGRMYRVEDALDRYVEYVKTTVNTDLKGLKVVVDCANGAAYRVAPRVLAELGAEVIAINHLPDGVNINDNCGSTHPEGLMAEVVKQGAHLGLAHDGDADRVLAVDSAGNLVDGDQIMVICAKHLKAKGKLRKNTVVVTVMSNLGLHKALEKSGISVVETKVGDRYVLEKLLETGTRFGGEQSGHIIFLEHNTTGDGIITALQLLAVVKETGKSLAQLAEQMEKYPQILQNVRVQDKTAVMNSPIITEAIRRFERDLAGQGRILVRPSGTEPLVRIMVEGKDMAELQTIVDKMAEIVGSI
ncbi:phosphoglucosamine mutase [Desulforamulus hydrothermalis]|uniref:Phosphoglucosamine mutase n=1 Tax=Desulforamulus hydrothermalis Lam5 = DSM 18033 TaxID=1121428 RepID=K8EGV4_9FIRM|nr:phosphoglucosamine mutase [Desulforamulus hydrothermalis]CCO07861.1 Phosphoglucosamine mutase [Desulforamulus hydrothermalis Lam5 = DSM 18033]SHH27918.1 phosphoglucosamine mutase [Desulforamulus hydrothermalis Lam5 = DSM 18033]